MEQTSNIQKVIHLMWFGGGNFPISVVNCLKTWKKILPDYKIKVWTYDMAKAIHNTYIDEALSVKKWAYAADVVRLYALYTEGGVYMDSDVIVKKRFDEYMTQPCSLFQEYHEKLVKSGTEIDGEGHRIVDHAVSGIGIQAALMISEPGHPMIKRMLDTYENRHFIAPDGSYNYSPNAPACFAMALEDVGYCYKDEIQYFDRMTIYPSILVSSSDEAFADHVGVHHGWNDKNIKQRIKSWIVSHTLGAIMRKQLGI